MEDRKAVTVEDTIITVPKVALEREQERYRELRRLIVTGGILSVLVEIGIFAYFLTCIGL